MKRERSIELIARGVCVRDGRLLLCRRRGAPRSYLPGGHIEFGEGARAALRREIAEELGRAAAVGRFLGALEYRFRDGGGRTVCEINLLFVLRIRGPRGGAAPASREPGIGFEWLPLSRLRRSDLEPRPLRRRLPGWIDGTGGAGWDSNHAAGGARP